MTYLGFILWKLMAGFSWLLLGFFLATWLLDVMLCFWCPCLHRVFTVFKGIWKENFPGLIVALIQAEPGGFRLSLSLQLYLTGPEPWEMGESRAGRQHTFLHIPLMSFLCPCFLISLQLALSIRLKCVLVMVEKSSGFSLAFQYSGWNI